ncbi:helix-turn-helix domain-containing protein [Glutamicibacter sp. X7]
MTERPFIHTVERLASVVHTERLAHHLSIEQLADKAGVSQHFLVDIEAGRPRAEVGKVLDVLVALDLKPRAIPVTTQWAFDGSGALRDGAQHD